MNLQHLQTFVWLRWRLLINQVRRHGQFNAIVMGVVAVGALLLAGPVLVASFLVGMFAFRDATPVVLMYTWDGVVVVFLFFWSMGLVAELQRTETMSLSKFMHLPVSVSGVFIINYVSSLLCLSLILFVPLMLGLACGLVAARGPMFFGTPLLVAAFLLMVTAITYQFQGWLASLMHNARRRRAVIVGATAIIVLLCQLPNLVNLFAFSGRQPPSIESVRLTEELTKLNAAFAAHKIDAVELQRRHEEVMAAHAQQAQQAQRESAAAMAAKVEKIARLVNRVLPIGWLPLGTMALAQRNVGPALLGFIGMTGIGTVSLWRAYQTTIGLYQGKFTRGQVAPRPHAPLATQPAVRGRLLLERHLPGFSEPVSAIALASVQSMIRSPEAKMMLLTPVVMSVIFGSTILRMPDSTPDAIRPLAGIGAMGLALFGVLQLMANQFGFDRDGFRVFVLCATPRRDVLLGKNLAFAPVTFGMATLMLVIVQVVSPMRLEHLLSMAPQFISMFLLFCTLMNLLSIYTPMPIAAGTLKPASPKIYPVLVQMVMFMIFFPLTQAPTLLPLGIEAMCRSLGWIDGAPLCLALSLVQCALVVIIYRWALQSQGALLQEREQSILDVVTNRAA